MTARRPREKWSGRASAAASFAISASWHVLVLAVLALAVHPLRFPPETPPVIVELFPPPITVAPPVEVEQPPAPTVQDPLNILRPSVPPEPVEVQRPPEPVPPQPLEAARPPQPVLSKPIQVERTPLPVAPKALEVKRPPDLLPPEPLEAARPLQPALPRPVEVERRPSPPRSLEVTRPPDLIAPAPAEAAPSDSASPVQRSAQLPVLTNESVVQAPVEIRPPARASARPLATAPAVPAFPAAGGAGGAGGAGSPAGAAPGGAVRPSDGRIVGFDDNLRNGLRMRLGCASPDTYRLTLEEKAECLRRLADQARGARAMGPNIPADKQADYDRWASCHAGTAAGAVPRSSGEDASTGSIRGLGFNPRLRDCGPGDR